MMNITVYKLFLNKPDLKQTTKPLFFSVIPSLLAGRGLSHPGVCLRAPSRENRSVNQERQTESSRKHLGAKLRGTQLRRKAHFPHGSCGRDTSQTPCCTPFDSHCRAVGLWAPARPAPAQALGPKGFLVCCELLSPTSFWATLPYYPFSRSCFRSHF